MEERRLILLPLPSLRDDVWKTIVIDGMYVSLKDWNEISKVYQHISRLNRIIEARETMKFGAARFSKRFSEEYTKTTQVIYKEAVTIEQALKEIERCLEHERS